MTTWDAAPDGKIVKTDVSIAKNYLNDKEMSYMERIVSLYLDYAELQAELHAETEFEKYRIVQDRMFMSDYDRFLLELEKQSKSE